MDIAGLTAELAKPPLDGERAEMVESLRPYMPTYQLTILRTMLEADAREIKRRRAILDAAAMEGEHP